MAHFGAPEFVDDDGELKGGGTWAGALISWLGGLAGFGGGGGAPPPPGGPAGPPHPPAPGGPAEFDVLLTLFQNARATKALELPDYTTMKFQDLCKHWCDYHSKYQKSLKRQYFAINKHDRLENMFQTRTLLNILFLIEIFLGNVAGNYPPKPPSNEFVNFRGQVRATAAVANAPATLEYGLMQYPELQMELRSLAHGSLSDVPLYVAVYEAVLGGAFADSVESAKEFTNMLAKRV